MIRHIKRYFAIRSYLRRLSHDLVRRFGQRPYYTVEHVTQAVKRGQYSAAFIAYAHAFFCRREDFDAYYLPLGVACTYDGLRQPLAKKYFPGHTDFDAQMVAAKFRSNAGNYYESDIGPDSGQYT